MFSLSDDDRSGLTPARKALVAGVAAVVGSAFTSAYMSSKAATDNPPIGKFVEVDGVRLHYIEAGSGAPVVYLHGNGSMLQDVLSSGLFDMLAKSHRIVAFDRPGFGYSERPSNVSWTAAAQAAHWHQCRHATSCPPRWPSGLPETRAAVAPP